MRKPVRFANPQILRRKRRATERAIEVYALDNTFNFA
jgi:hypothetical protein